jgi:hypothetical protein
MPVVAARNLVDLVEEDDASVLDAIAGLAVDLLGVDELLGLLLGQDLTRLGDGDTLLFAPTKEPGKHLLEVDSHLFDSLRGEHLEAGKRCVLDFDIY